VLATAARGRELYVSRYFLQISRNCGELLKSSFQIFYDLKLVRCPRSLDPTLVTNASPASDPSMSLIPFAPFSGDDMGI